MVLCHWFSRQISPLNSIDGTALPAIFIDKNDPKNSSKAANEGSTSAAKRPARSQNDQHAAALESSGLYLSE
jgi:hypothetical protein